MLAGVPYRYPAGYDLNPTPSASSAPDSMSGEHPRMSATGKRKIERACDACRRRKTKCDGSKMPDNVCTNCIQTKRPCTYVETSKPRGPPKAYVTGMEDKLERMEALLKRLFPDQDFSEELGPPVVRGSWREDGEASSEKKPTVQFKTPQASLKVPFSSILDSMMPLPMSTHLTQPFSYPEYSHGNIPNQDVSSSESDSDSSDEEGPAELMKRIGLKALGTENAVSSLDDKSFHARFHGKSSSIRLGHATRRFKKLKVLERTDGHPEGASAYNLPHIQRPEYWRMAKWEQTWEGFHLDSQGLLHFVLSEFPPHDLAEALIDLYFTHVNVQFPLLHQPTFTRQWNEGLHHRHIWFATLCLALFSVSSRFSDDERVLPPKPDLKDGVNDKNDWVWAGYGYYVVAYDVHEVRRSLLYPPTLFEVQGLSLLAMHARAYMSPTQSWILVTVALRKAQDVGAHRKATYSSQPSVEEELWKRAFWVLIALDRIDSTDLGRSSCVGDEDFDLDPPLEVDDEYWENEDPSKAFVQPDGVPALTCGFNHWLKVVLIMGFTIRTLYPINNSNTFLGRLAIQRRPEIVEQLNHALTQWADSVSEHLRWSNQKENTTLAHQSATLYLTYHLAQILVYRPFIMMSHAATSPNPSSPQRSDFPYPALAICTNAARACARIVEWQKVRAFGDMPSLVCVGHICTAILLVSVWDLRGRDWSAMSQEERDQGKKNMESLMTDIDILMRALEKAEDRYANVTLCLRMLRNSLPNADDDTFNESWKVLDKHSVNGEEIPALEPMTLLHAMHPVSGPPEWQASGSGYTASSESASVEDRPDVTLIRPPSLPRRPSTTTEPPRQLFLYDDQVPYQPVGAAYAEIPTSYDRDATPVGAVPVPRPPVHANLDVVTLRAALPSLTGNGRPMVASSSYESNPGVLSAEEQQYWPPEHFPDPRAGAPQSPPRYPGRTMDTPLLSPYEPAAYQRASMSMAAYSPIAPFDPRSRYSHPSHDYPPHDYNPARPAHYSRPEHLPYGYSYR